MSNDPANPSPASLENFYFSGVNPDISDYFTPPDSPKNVFDAVITGHDQELLDDLQKKIDQIRNNIKNKIDPDHWGVLYPHEPENLADVGWCLLYPPGTDPEILKQLKPLVDHRNDHKGKHWPSMEVNPGKYASAYDFRIEHGQHPGPTDPQFLPYYMLIVGPPTGISYEFQHDLDAMHAVGRICFRTPQEYGSYAKCVVDYEQGKTSKRQRSLAVFAPNSDKTTRQSADLLALPVAQQIASPPPAAPGSPTVAVYPVIEKHAAQANKLALIDLLASQAGLLFSATHGLTIHDPAVPLASQYPRQLAEMGALTCQDWDKVEKGKPLPAGYYLAGKDITPALDLTGLIVFSFACWSAGAPKFEKFSRYYKRLPQQLAVEDFVSYLPQRMLAQGALAFIGHVEQTWSYSYGWKGVGAYTSHFVSSIQQILAGSRVGHALEPFNQRDLDLNNMLTGDDDMYEKQRKNQVSAPLLLETWIARQDARGWVLFGDPAVGLQ